MIVAGFGFRTLASTDSLLNALEKAVGSADISIDEITTYSAPDDKIEASVFQKLLTEASIKAVSVRADDISGFQTLTNSERVQDMRGTGSVAEACALIATGPEAELLGPRVISDDRMATCALAKGDDA